jgi:hypothetical protein
MLAILATIVFTAPTASFAQRLPPTMGKNHQEGAKTPLREELINIIKLQQSYYVRESWGTEEGQCFTDKDLESFNRNGTIDSMTSKLKTDPRFQQLVEKMKSLRPDIQSDILLTAGKTYKPTWAEVGKIDKSGQTDAGQKAEKEIATAITELTEQMLFNH